MLLNISPESTIAHGPFSEGQEQLHSSPRIHKALAVLNDTRLWLWVRVAIVAIGGISGFSFASPEAVAQSNLNWGACVLIFLVVPFGLLFVIGIQAFNPMSATTWRRPSWYINPFLFSEPLQFFHFGAFYFIAGGLVGVATLPFRGFSAAPLAFSLISVGLGMWLGVQLCMITFRKKMEVR